MIWIDFETYYDAEYSLKKLSTEEYIRDPRFLVHGMSYAFDDEPVQWVRAQDVPDVLEELVASGDDAWCAHNAAFDMAILGWRYDVHPPIIRDTLSMARCVDFYGKHSLDALVTRYGIGKKGDALVKTLGLRDLPADVEAALAAYCCQDTALLRELYAVLRTLMQNQLGGVRARREMELIDVTIKMFTSPIFEVDREILKARLAELEAQRDEAIRLSGVDEAVLMSNQQFMSVLATQGVTLPDTLRKTDPDLLALLDNPQVAHIVRGRLACKSLSELRRTAKFVSIGERGGMPIALKYYGAHTGRWSGWDGTNAQNLNRGSALRRSLVAPPGYVVVVIDSSQIEARVAMWLAGQADVLAQFAANEDVYTAFARKIWPGQEIDKLRRFVGKTCMLGLQYYVGAEKLHAQITLKSPTTTLEEAQSYVNVYRNTMGGIRKMWRMCDRMLAAMTMHQTLEWVHGVQTSHEQLRLPSGRVLRYPGLRATRDGYEYGEKPVKKIYSGALFENIVQAIARDIVADQMLVISRKYSIALMTHDEIVFVAREKDADAALAFGMDVMRYAPSYAAGLPLNCEGGYDKCYSK